MAPLCEKPPWEGGECDPVNPYRVSEWTSAQKVVVSRRHVLDEGKELPNDES